MERIRLVSEDTGASAEVTTHGAHVVSFVSRDKEVLFVSRKAIFEPPKAIRGGIPICFPQFSDFGPCRQHGFARNSTFKVESKSASSVVLVLRGVDIQHEEFPYKFVLRICVEIKGDALVQKVDVVNEEENVPFEFSFAFHTYFRVQHVDQARLIGLQNCRYLDSLSDREERVEDGEDIRFGKEEVDRIYLNSPSSLTLMDGENRTSRMTQSESLRDVVVWNPYIDKSKSMKDLDDDEWKDFVCAEAAQAGSGLVTLKPGESWSGEIMITAS
ncbi:hypothetical protein PSENEW3n2_00003781 [Picochlorum sp. SENEW3]|nr:hypothetical protein PSENEW3n2_00003781 [Picochlorum sp. SENEW3]WPT18481.1 hypothetical protein PSENEW3_00003781 [Picochlorum sp. SENEW3]